VSLSARAGEVMLSVWSRRSAVDAVVRNRLGERLKRVLGLEKHSVLAYKDHMRSLHDRSGRAGA